MAHSKWWLRRLERRVGSNSILLKDGSRYHYDFDEAAGDLFVYCIRRWSAEEDEQPPEEPEILQAIRNARDPKAAMARFRADDPERGFVDPLVLLDEDGEGDVA